MWLDSNFQKCTAKLNENFVPHSKYIIYLSTAVFKFYVDILRDYNTWPHSECCCKIILLKIVMYMRVFNKINKYVYNILNKHKI